MQCRGMQCRGMQCRGMQRTSLSLGCRRRRRRHRMCRWMQGWVVGSSEEGQQGMGRGGEGIRCRGWQQPEQGRGGMPNPVECMQEEVVEDWGEEEEGGMWGREQGGGRGL